MYYATESKYPTLSSSTMILHLSLYIGCNHKENSPCQTSARGERVEIKLSVKSYQLHKIINLTATAFAG